MQQNQINQELKLNIHSVLVELNHLKSSGQISDSIANQYASLTVECEQLVQMTAPFFALNEEGTYPIFTLDDKNKLLTAYENISRRCGAIDQLLADKKTKVSTFIKETTQKLETFLGQDIRGLVKVDSDTTLPEIIQGARTRVIDITNQETKTIGENLSSRQIIQDGEKKCIFTKNSTFDFEESKQAIKDKYNTMFPEYKDYFALFDDRSHFTGNFVLPKFNDSANINYSLDAFIDGGVPLFIKDKDDPDRMKVVNLFKSDPVFGKALYSYLYDAWALSNKKFFNDIVQNDKNEPVEERNSAMSVVAELLGMKDIICHSEAVIIKNGNQELHGNLMDFAKGEDISNINPESDLATIEPNKITITPQAKKQICDLQLLDYICGNIDRHGANVFYQYDLSDKNHPKLTGIQGIDNDCSFYTSSKIKSNVGYGKMTGLQFLATINKDTADRIKLISPAMLKVSLQGLHLNDEAIKKAMERYSNLQKVLELNAVSYQKGNPLELNDKSRSTPDRIKINVIENEEDWDSINPKDTINRLNRQDRGTIRGNLFNTVEGNMGGSQSMTDIAKEVKEKHAASLSISKELNASIATFMQEQKNIDSGTKRFRGSSNQYKNIQKELVTLYTKDNQLLMYPTPESLDKYVQSLSSVRDHVQAYLDRKKREEYSEANPKGEKYGAYTNNRIKLMTNLCQSLNEKITSLNEKNNDLKIVENSLIGKANAKKRLSDMNSHTLWDNIQLGENEKNKNVETSKVATNDDLSKENNNKKLSGRRNRN